MKPNQRREQKKKTRRLALCAVLAALGTVAISLGSLIEILDLCTAAFAALLCVVVVIEYGGGYPWGVYLATAILSLLIAPQKTPAVIYALLGFYPIVKAYVERLPRFAAAGIKCLIFAVLEVGMITFTDLLTGADQVMPPWYYVALYALAFVTLWLYDVLITRLVTRYLFRWRQRIAKFF